MKDLEESLHHSLASSSRQFRMLQRRFCRRAYAVLSYPPLGSSNYLTSYLTSMRGMRARFTLQRLQSLQRFIISKSRAYLRPLLYKPHRRSALPTGTTRFGRLRRIPDKLMSNPFVAFATDFYRVFHDYGQRCQLPRILGMFLPLCFLRVSYK